MEYAYTYVRDNGIEKESDYPYAGYLGGCRFSKSLSVLKVWQYMSIPSGDEAALQNAVGGYIQNMNKQKIFFTT